MPDNNIIGTQVPDEYEFEALYMAALICNTLRVFYSGTNAEARARALRSYVWAPDNATDGGGNPVGTLVIDDIDKWNPTRIGAGPAIYVRMNDLAYIKYGLGGNQHISPGVTDLSGVETFTKGLAGSMTIFCLSTIPYESRMLSIDVARNLQHFSKSLRKKLRLNAFEVTKIQAPRPLREKPTHLASIVTAEFGCYETWLLEQITPILADIRFHSAGTGPTQ